MPKGYPITERQRVCVLRLHAERRFSRQEIADACGTNRVTVTQIIDDAAANFYLRCLCHDAVDDHLDPHDS